jgi:hypothetical protein
MSSSMTSDRGRILPWRDVMNQEPRTGELRIEECLDSELHRYVRAARLFDVQSAIYSDKLPELLDVRLMAMSPQAFTLTGLSGECWKLLYAGMALTCLILLHSTH